MLSAKDEAEGQRELEIESDDESELEVGIEHTIDGTKRETFIRNLVKAGQDEALAIRALEHVDPEDFSQGICLMILTTLLKILYELYINKANSL